MNDVIRISKLYKMFEKTKDIFNTIGKEEQLNKLIDLIMEDKAHNEMLKNIPRSVILNYVLELDKYNKLYCITSARLIIARLMSTIDYDYIFNLRMLTIPQEFKEKDKGQYYRIRSDIDTYEVGFGLDDNVKNMFFSKDLIIHNIHSHFYHTHKVFFNGLSTSEEFFLERFIFVMIVHYVDTHPNIDYDEIYGMLDKTYIDFKNVYMNAKLNGLKDSFGDPFKYDPEDLKLYRYVEQYVDNFHESYKIAIR